MSAGLKLNQNPELAARFMIGKSARPSVDPRSEPLN